MLRKSVKIFASILLLYGISFGIILPWIMPKVLPNLLRDNAGINIDLNQAKLNPFTFELTLLDLQLFDQSNTTLMRLDEFKLDLNPLALIKKEFLIANATIINPRLFIHIHKNGNINLLNILPPQPKTTNQEGEPHEPNSSFHFSLKHAQIINGAVSFKDASGDKVFATNIEHLNYTLRDFSTKPGIVGAHQLGAKGALFENIAWEGGVSLNPLRLYGEFWANGLSLAHWWEYLAPKEIPYWLENANVWMGLPYQIYFKDGSLHVSLNKAWIDMDNFNLSQNDKPFIQFKKFKLDSHLFEATFKDDSLFNMGGLSIKGSNLHVHSSKELPFELQLNEIALNNMDAKYQNGDYNLYLKSFSLAGIESFLDSNPSAFAGFSELLVSETKLQPNSIQIDAIKLDKPFLNSVLNDDYLPDFLANIPPTSQESNSSKLPWKFILNNFNISDGKANITTPTQNHSLDSLHVKAHNLHYPASQNIQYSLESNLDEASIQSSGVFNYEPILWDGDFDLSHPNLAHYNPYIKPFFLGKINDGALHVNGAGSFLENDWKVSGGVNLANFLLHGAKESKVAEVKELKINQINASSNALYLKDINVSQPYLNMHIYENMETNLDELFPSNSSDSKSKDSNASPIDLTIEGIVLRDGMMDFADDSLPLPFKVRIEDLGGEFSSFETQNTKPAKVRLEGQVEPHGYTKIEGELFPLDPTQKLNINVLFKNIDMTRLSPYSGKFVGYALKDGKLDLDLGYLIENANLKGENSIVMHDLTLGDTIESPDAINLPLQLAIALLKDSEGKIDIELPVSGDVNDPKFSYGTLIFKAIGNLITGIATSPFRFLGNILGVDGETLKSIEFEPGFAILLPPAKEKIDNYIKILSKRPGIKLQITPAYDIESDSYALKTANLQAQFDGSTGVPYGELLTILYLQSFPPKDLEALKLSHTNEGKLNTRALEESMFEALVKIQLIDDGMLENLAKERANVIYSTLISKGVSEKNLEITPTTKGEFMEKRWVELPINIAL